MPADSPRNAVARQWELLKCLPSSPQGKSTAALTLALAEAGYSVTKRTVERDLEALESLFPITHGESQPYDWHWVKGSDFSVLGLSTTDALTLHLLERFLKPILPAATVRQLQPMFELAANKLAAQKESNALGGWASKVAVVEPSLPVVPASIDSAAMQSIQEAMLAGEQIAVAYISTEAKVASTRTLNPLGLVQCGSITYLVATGHKHSSPRLYAMHRVRAAKRLHEPAKVPEGFSLQAFIDEGGLQFGNGPRICIKAWVSQMLGRQLTETRLCEDQHLAPLEPANDGFMLTATLNYSWRLRWWILSKSGDIEVKEPMELRSEIGDLLLQAANRYVS